MEASDKTVEFWRNEYQKTIENRRKELNFWDLPTADSMQRSIAFPNGMNGFTYAGPCLLSMNVQPGILKHGVSIGCGSGHKEVELLTSGLVEHMTLIEVVPDLIGAAKSIYESWNLLDRVTFVLDDFQETLTSQQFDLIYFDNALHHMSGVESLLRQCVTALRPAGFFVMDDFVGPSYNQFSPEHYDYADRIRAMLPASAFVGENAVQPLGLLTVQDWLNADPSEACDSATILPAIQALMPGARIIPTGGLVYYLACREAYGALTSFPDRDESILRLLFELDRVLVAADPSLTCYALAIWQKPQLPSTSRGDHDVGT